MLLTKRFKFEAAHNLLNYHGDCERLHGHSYTLEVTLKGSVGENGFMMDFRELSRFVLEKVIKRLDHSYINDVIKISTCENISKWIWNELKGLPLHEIKLFETEDSWVVYNGD